VGGRQGGWPYLSERGFFIDSHSNWTLSDLSGQNIYDYSIATGEWHTDPALQNPSQTGSSVDGSFGNGHFGWDTHRGVGYVHDGWSAAGTARADPNANVTTIYTSADAGAKYVAAFDTTNWTWTNKTISSRLVQPGTGHGNMVSLTGTESNEGGLAVVLGGNAAPDTVSLHPKHSPRVSIDSVDVTGYAISEYESDRTVRH
jgi:hypothetical protein